MKKNPLCRSYFFLFLLVTCWRALAMERIVDPKKNSNETSFQEQLERAKQSTDSFSEISESKQRRTDGKLPGEKITTANSSPNDGAEIFHNVPSCYTSYSSQMHSSNSSPKENELRVGIDSHHSMEGYDLEARKAALKTELESKLFLRQPTEECMKQGEVELGQKCSSRKLLRAASFPIIRRSTELPRTPLVTPPRNKASITRIWKEGSIPKLGLSEPLSAIEQIIAIAFEKNKAASAAVNANHAILTEAARSVQQVEFNKLANLWVNVAEVSSLLQDETNQLRELTRQMELSHSLLESESVMSIETASSQNKKLAQDEINLLTKTIASHEKTVHFLFRGTTIIDEWIHNLWTNHLIFAVSSSSDVGADDLETREVEKENCYKNGVSILQIFAANHSEDEDQESASFFARVAESEYSKMQDMISENKERCDEIIERNKRVLAFCSTVDSLQEKIRENKDLATQASQERIAVLYGEAVQWHEENCRLIMSMVEQLISDSELDPALENRSNALSDLASGAELQAKRLEKL